MFLPRGIDKTAVPPVTGLVETGKSKVKKYFRATTVLKVLTANSDRGHPVVSPRL